MSATFQGLIKTAVYETLHEAFQLAVNGSPKDVPMVDGLSPTLSVPPYLSFGPVSSRWELRGEIVTVQVDGWSARDSSVEADTLKEHVVSLVTSMRGTLLSGTVADAATSCYITDVRLLPSPVLPDPDRNDVDFHAAVRFDFLVDALQA